MKSEDNSSSQLPQDWSINMSYRKENESVSTKGPGPRQCGCKGIRSCKLCESSNSEGNSKEEENLTTLYYLPASKTLSFHPASHSLNHRPAQERSASDNSSTSTSTSEVRDYPFPENEFGGIEIVEDFISEDEEKSLVKDITATPFVNSQSGRRKQDFGPKVNFKKQKVKMANFSGLPNYSQTLYERMRLHPCLRDFEPVEMCNLEYCQTRGAHIDPHFDDAWLWGERLVTLNLLTDSVLTFTKDARPGVQIRVPLKRRSLIIVSGPARHEWKHGIQAEDICETRIATTFRELSEEFQNGGQREKDGSELLQLALSFRGVAIGGS